MPDTTRYTFSFNPDCPTCKESSVHLPEIGVWACPFCGRLAIEYNEKPEGEVLDFLPDGNDPIDAIKIFGVFSSHDGLKSLLGTYESKDDLHDLPRESTSRRWNPDRSGWTVDASATEEVKEHLRDAGWPVIDLVRLRRERRQEDE